MLLIKRLLGVFAVLLLVTASYAGEGASSIVGKWRTLDDTTGEPNSVITIWRSNDVYLGKISKIYSVNKDNPKEICMKCKGERYNKPILGLVIITNMVARGDKYVGGEILDPRDGKTYHCTLKVGDDGKTLKVRGYIGMPLFGQTKTWYRVSS